MTAVSPILNNQVNKIVSYETNNTQSSTNADSAKILKNDTFTKSDKAKVALASMAGGAAGVGTGLVSSCKLWGKTIKNLFASYGESGVDKKLVDNLGELAVKYLQGEKITGLEGQQFFDNILRPQATVAMEEFIKNNNLTCNSNPKEVKKLLKKCVAKDEVMKEHVAKLKNTISYAAGANGLTDSPFAAAKNTKSIFIQKLGSGAIKKYAAITAAAVAIGAAVAGGATALILKQKNKTSSSQVQ